MADRVDTRAERTRRRAESRACQADRRVAAQTADRTGATMTDRTDSGPWPTGRWTGAGATGQADSALPDRAAEDRPGKSAADQAGRGNAHCLPGGPSDPAGTGCSQQPRRHASCRPHRRGPGDHARAPAVATAAATGIPAALAAAGHAPGIPDPGAGGPAATARAPLDPAIGGRGATVRASPGPWAGGPAATAQVPLD